MSISAIESLRIVASKGAARPSKKQQRFNTLVKKAAQLKQSLRSWSLALPDIHRGIAEHERLLEEHRGVVSQLVRLFDRMYSDRSLTKRERQLLRQIICDTARELVQNADSDDLKAIYNRHSGSDYDVEAAQDDADKARMMKAVLERGFGLDFEGEDIQSLDELQRVAREQLDELDRAAERRAEQATARKSQRKKSPKQLQAEMRRETERAQVGKTLQAIYRKLAIALHPDHEHDVEERARKTLLMQQVNVAYEANDLLRLLELQLQFEQVDQAQLGTIAEDRLDHFNTLLAEQVGQLQIELATVEEPWRMQLDVPPGVKLAPARVQGRLQQDLRTLAEDIAHARRDLAVFQDVRALKAWLRAAREAARRSDDEWLDFD